MATLPIQNLQNPLPSYNTLNGFPTVTVVKTFEPIFPDEHTFPIADLANLGTIIANPIDVNPIYPLPDHAGGGGGGGNPVGYAS